MLFSAVEITLYFIREILQSFRFLRHLILKWFIFKIVLSSHSVCLYPMYEGRLISSWPP